MTEDKNNKTISCEHCEGKNVAEKKFLELREDHLTRYAEGFCPNSDCPISTLRRIDLNTQQLIEIANSNNEAILNNTGLLESHGRILETIADTQKHYMGAIAKNTKHIAINLNNYNKQNQKMLPILSGKKQVPLSVFLVILIATAIITIMMFASFTHYQLVLDESSVSVTHQQNSTARSK